MKIAKYIIKNFLIMIMTLILASFLVFALIRMSKTDPVTVIMKNRPVTEDVRAQITEEYNLDKSIFVQYGIWVKNLFSGDLGKDYVKKQDVSYLIKGRLGVTLALVIYSTIISLIIAIPAGVICAIKKNTFIDQIISSILLFMTSIPGFVSSIIFLVIASKVFPSYSASGTPQTFGELISRLTLPAIALSFNSVALFARVTRSSMIQQLKSGYITTAKAKGISQGRIVFGHALHNGILPVITVVTVTVGSSISYGVLVEKIFSLTGIGNLLISSVQSYNYPVTQILVLMLLIIFMVISFIADVIYVLVDPRVNIE